MEMNGFGFAGFNFEENKKDRDGVQQDFVQNGFGNDWGLSLESFFGSPDEKKSKENADDSKKNGKKKKSSNKSNGKDEDVKLPVTVIARGFEKNLEGSGTMKLSEVGKKLIEEGYHQFEIPGMAFFYVFYQLQLC